MSDTPQDPNGQGPLAPINDEGMVAAAEEVTAENRVEQQPANDGLTKDNDVDRGEAEGDGGESTEKSETKTTAPVPATPEKIVNPLTADPYEFEKCTIAVQIVLLPHDGDIHGREVIVGVRNHQDTPIIRVFRMDEVPFPEAIHGLLEELRNQLPSRAMEKIERETKEAKKRKAATTQARPTAKPATPVPASSPTAATASVVAPAKPGKAPSPGQLDMFNSLNS